MKLIKVSFWVFLASLLSPTVAKAAVPTTSGWATVVGSETTNGFKIYRKYSFISGSSQGIPNTITYRCSENPDDDKKNSYLTITLPNEFPIKSFKRLGHIAQFGVQVKVDNDEPFYIMSEYKDGELFIDRNSYTEFEFTKMLRADDLDVLFGAKEDEIAFHMTEKVDQALAGVGSDGSGLSLSMHFTQFSRHDMEQDCSKHSKKQQ